MIERVSLEPNFMPPVLISESAHEQRRIHRALEQEIRPNGIIEKMYVADIAANIFDTLRLRRAKVGIINASFREALQRVLRELLEAAGPGRSYSSFQEEANTLALGWFTDDKSKRQVLEMLSWVHLDESVIEAEAIRRRSSDLESLDSLLASLELRRNRALACVAEYRESLAERLNQSANRIIETQNAPRIEHSQKKSTAA
jgi:hypothetical protein